MNRKKFFDSVRPMFGGKLTTPQVEGMEAILNEGEKQKIITPQLAYILGTVKWETASTMQPIEEVGKGKGRKYGRKIDIDGKPYTTPDKIFYGRGHTQNTWLSNYKKLTATPYAKSKGWDFVNKPELLLTMEPSVWATFHAMTTGLYTTKKLSDYITNTKKDYFNARKIVNGLDKAKEIQVLAEGFEKALIAAQ